MSYAIDETVPPVLRKFRRYTAPTTITTVRNLTFPMARRWGERHPYVLRVVSLRHDEEQMTLSPAWRERLRQAVRASGKKQSVIALDSGLTPETVCKILNATHARPSFDSIVKIAHAAGVSVGWVLEEPEFSLTDEQRGKVRAVGTLLLDLTGGMPKSSGRFRPFPAVVTDFSEPDP